MRLFVGLGNPGKKYEATRHNIGFLVLKSLAASLEWEFKEKSPFYAWVARGEYKGQSIHLLMPTTYMNESGLAVRRYMDYVKTEVQDLLVVVDDVALPYGELRLRSMGSSGGQNGLKSVEAHLGTQHYARLRMGIGHPGDHHMADFVLSGFTKEEQMILPQFIQSGANVLKQLVDESITHVMKTVNTKPQKRLI